MKTYHTHELMKEWNHTWQWHHLPLWAKVRLRKLAIRNKEWIPNTSRAEFFLPERLFDHWGSIKRGDLRVIMTQPYENPDEEAAQWAHDMDLHVEQFSPAPWHPDTRAYIFSPRTL